ncbi:MAG: hypothetical protein J6T38_01790 [Bacteroidaceae bacterium]|nr:hypothetical protein [Bacteroidaceae bacterium]
MKKVLSLIAALTLGVLTTWAEDFNLYYMTADGTLAAQKWEVNQLQKITFEEGKMNVIAADGTSTEISTAGIKKLVFFTESGVTDIEEIEEVSQDQAKDEVYDLMGRLVTLSPDQLPKGIYIINGKKTLVK